MSKKKVKVGNLTLGGEHIYIQSMLNIPADDVEGNVRQAIELEKAGLYMRLKMRSIYPLSQTYILITG